MKIAFIGLGNMGLPMARRLLEHGHELVLYSRTRTRTAPLEESGAVAKDSPSEAVASVEAVCLCLPGPREVREVAEALLPALPAGATIVDFSTVDPGTCRHVDSLARQRGARYLDAPVSGGVRGATAGTLAVMASGDKEAFERVSELFAAVGKRVEYLGEVGVASCVKLINQLLVAANLAAAAEAAWLATRAGLDLRQVYSILSASAGRSQMLTYLLEEHLLTNDFSPGFSLRLLCKDLDLVMGMARDLHAPVLMTSQARSLYDLAAALGLEEMDMSAVMLALQRILGGDHVG